MTRLEQIEMRLKDIYEEISTEGADVKALASETDVLLEERKRLMNDKSIAERKSTLAKVAQMGGTPVMDIINNKITDNRSKKTMENTEYRELAEYLIKGTPTAEMRGAMGTSDVGAVLPETIYDQMLYSGAKDNASILQKATVTRFDHNGTIKIPVLTANSASWHTETNAVTPADRTITNISLGGYELMSLVSFSTAALSKADDSFEEYISKALYEEMGTTLEYAMINGTGSGQATGILAGITWTSANSVTTATTSTEISVDDIISGIALLPSRFRRNASIMGNSATIYGKIRKLKDDNDNYLMAIDGASASILGIPVVIADDVPDDVIIIGDISKYFINFARPITLERSTDSGFRSAVIDVRALAVVDGKPFADAFVKVAKKTA